MIDEKTLRNVAEIARLKLNDDEILKMKEDFGVILGHFKKIGEIEGGDETYYVVDVAHELREDSVSKTDANDIRKLFNRSRDGYLLAPKSLE
ncbi:MAG: Asp-tRNA(Asn)/Glu-tRNA(Gln) amidotransferase subunit GatC [Candidatus Micrarchaeia archaeon]